MITIVAIPPRIVMTVRNAIVVSIENCRVVVVNVSEIIMMMGIVRDVLNALMHGFNKKKKKKYKIQTKFYFNFFSSYDEDYP